MEKGEPTFVPQWLKSAGSVTGGGSSTHHFASSSSSNLGTVNNRSFKSISDFDTPRTAILERSASSNSRRTSSSSSNGSSKHPYSSFGRSHRDREKERSVSGDHWDTDSLGNMFNGRAVKDTLKHSQSMVSRTQNNNHHNGNGVISRGIIGSTGIKKTVFDKDFPSLGNEERQGLTDIGRVSSPNLTSAIQSLPIGNSALMGGEGWSALVEVPMVIGSNSVGPQSAAATPAASGAPATVAGLNMAEALAQAPSRARSAPQVSVETQRLEELAIKKSRQLIPMTPAMPKASLINSSDKSKPKASLVRSGEIIGATKNGQQQPSSLNPATQSLRVGQVKSEPPKAGKFLVLKPVRENGIVSHAPKDVACPSSIPLSLAATSVERKPVPLPLNLGPLSEKRPLSQAKSRSDFFNLMRKKTSMNISTGAAADPGSFIEKSDEVATVKEVDGVIGNDKVSNNGDAASGEEVKKLSDDEAVVYPDEEEVAFLRSLGWDENGGEEDEGLTEEEINAFYQVCLKLKPSLKICQGMQPKLSESCATDMGGAEVSSSGSDSDN